MLVTLAVVAFTLNGIYIVKGIKNRFMLEALAIYDVTVIANFLGC